LGPSIIPLTGKNNKTGLRRKKRCSERLLEGEKNQVPQRGLRGQQLGGGVRKRVERGAALSLESVKRKEVLHTVAGGTTLYEIRNAGDDDPLDSRGAKQ